jgi:hypothetical protein
MRLCAAGRRPGTAADPAEAIAATTLNDPVGCPVGCRGETVPNVRSWVPVCTLLSAHYWKPVTQSPTNAPATDRYYESNPSGPSGLISSPQSDSAYWMHGNTPACAAALPQCSRTNIKTNRQPIEMVSVTCGVFWLTIIV